jgi:F0F1-type ATP synthase delta subunit
VNFYQVKQFELKIFFKNLLNNFFLCFKMTKNISNFTKMQVYNFQSVSAFVKAVMALNLPKEKLERMASEVLTISSFEHKKLKFEIIKNLPLLEETKKFMQIIFEQKKAKLLKGIAHFLKLHFLEKNNTKLVKITTAEALNSQEEEMMAKELKNQFNSEILIEKEVDKTLISGFKLNFGAYLLDFSKKAKISKIKTCILK